MTDADLERLLSLDAAPGPALAIDTSRSDAIIDAALAGAGFGPGGGAGGSASGGSAAAGTKLAIVAGAALAVVAIVLLVGRGRDHTTELAIAPVADAAIIDQNGGGGSVATVAPDATLAAPSDPVTDEPIDMTDLAPATEPAQRAHESAADLLGAANAKRAAKQWRESDALYARVVDSAPDSLAAQTALIASASIRLEHLGDPRGATKRLRRALEIAPSGALAEEARWGLAEAARANHDLAAEAAALDAFLTHHPGSPLVNRAKARRAELP